MGWNHNVHYHRFVKSQLPPGCLRALDVGCGRGALALKLARACGEVTAIDSDRQSVDSAKTACAGQSNLTFVIGDVFTEPFQPGSFDAVVVVAALHHLPLKTALERFRDLLGPSGVLVVVGLYRRSTLTDFLFSAAALPVSLAARVLMGEDNVGAPIQDPKETLQNIHQEFASVLPGTTFRRRFFFRYSAIWRKPAEYAKW